MLENHIKFEISNIEWHRIYLNIEVETSFEGDVSFALENFRNRPGNVEYGNLDFIIDKTIHIKSSMIDNGKHKIELNMATIDNREFLDNGRWRIVAFTKGGNHVCHIKHDVAYKFEDLSRVFSYGGGKYAYNVSFTTIIENEANLWFVINSYFLKINNKWRKRNYVEEAKTTIGKIKSSYKQVVVALIKAFYKVVEGFYHKKGKNVLMMSETKDYLWGNLLYIDNRLKERGLDKEFNITYSFRRAVGNKNSVFSWVKLVLSIAKQDYIFIDDYAPIFGFLNLSKNTKLIQVWHAGVGFKSVGYSRFGKEGSPYPMESCHKKYDYALIGSKPLKHVYAEVFGIEDEAFLPVGMPRLDGFLDEEKIFSFKEGFYKEYPYFKDKKIILFAPTFRGPGQKYAYYNYDWLDLKQIYDFCADEYIFLIKMHPFVRERINIPSEYKDRIIDFYEYKNINDLYYVTNVLVTDYSSNYFEYSLLKRPVIFFTPDRELYEISRGVHRPVKESAPGKVCDTFEAFIDALKNEDFELEKIYQFVEDNFGEYDGQASDKVIDAVLLNRRG